MDFQCVWITTTSLFGLTVCICKQSMCGAIPPSGPRLKKLYNADCRLECSASVNTAILTFTTPYNPTKQIKSVLSRLSFHDAEEYCFQNLPEITPKSIYQLKWRKSIVTLWWRGMTEIQFIDQKSTRWKLLSEETKYKETSHRILFVRYYERIHRSRIYGNETNTCTAL